jgi:hypothetical protein
MWGDIPTPHGPCSYCFNPYHHVRDCPEMRQFSNYHYEHMTHRSLDQVMTSTLIPITRHGANNLISRGRDSKKKASMK